MFVIIVGVLGLGKIVMVCYIVLKLQVEGYEIILIIDKNKFVDYCDF